MPQPHTPLYNPKKGGDPIPSNKTFWHDAFPEALKLELHEYLDHLDFAHEYPLSKEALIMDLLILKKDSDLVIEKKIGRNFREHNIFEFKSWSDYLSVWDFNKVVGYTYLYSSISRVPIAQLTISFVVYRKPAKLLRHLESTHGLSATFDNSCTYYIGGYEMPIQIINASAAAGDELLFLRNMRRGLSAAQVTRVFEAGIARNVRNARNSYFHRLLQANPISKEEAKIMHDVLKEIFRMIADEDEYVIEKERAAAQAARRENSLEIAKNFLAIGTPAHVVASATGLDPEEVLELTNEQ